MIGKLAGWRGGDTIGSILGRHRGVGPGFDVLRILLAALIFYSHARYIARGASPDALPLVKAATTVIATHANAGAILAQEGGWTTWHRPFVVSLVPMFFALSGFLVTGSAIRLRHTATFLAFRALRIFPALATEVALSALVVGPLLTAFTLEQYFTDPQFYAYFGNIIGYVTFNLPGLFLNNPAPNAVNLNLWTLPGELYCYMAMAICMITGIIYNRMFFTIALFIITVVALPLNLFGSFDVVDAALPTRAIAYYFLVGVAIYHWRDHIPVHPVLFIAAALLSFTLLMSKHTVYVVPTALAYCTICFGMIGFPKIKLLASGDYSYGIYLYGFPICQALAPGFRGNVWALLLVGGLLTCAFAVASWHLVEKRVLVLKRRLPERLFPDASRNTIPQEPEQRAKQSLADPSL